MATKFGIKETPTRYFGSWSCTECDAGGAHREAATLAAQHARETGHETTSRATAETRNVVAPLPEAMAWGKRVPLATRPLTEDEEALLRAVTRWPSRWWRDYVALAGLTEERLGRARGTLARRGRIAERRVTGGVSGVIVVLEIPAQTAA